jgi:hypothetical protein
MCLMHFVKHKLQSALPPSISLIIMFRDPFLPLYCYNSDQGYHYPSLILLSLSERRSPVVAVVPITPLIP